jgi:squid-like protein
LIDKVKQNTYLRVNSNVQVLSGGEHAINSKKVDVKRAKAKPGKIFVGGLTPEMQDEEIKNYFSQFGLVTECEMPFDKTKNQRKNFCFITFEREETMKELLKSPKQKIGEVEVDVKRATPKSGKYSLFCSFIWCISRLSSMEAICWSNLKLIEIFYRV